MGRKTRARAILEMLQLVVVELDAVKLEKDPERVRERLQLANRMIVDAVAAVKRWEVQG